MAEMLKILADLVNMGQHLNIGVLKHYFKTFDPTNSKALRESINHFHLKELEGSDYRSAYHQFCDWLYGWNVTDVAELADTTGATANYLKLKRVPREIIMGLDREKQDCERLLTIFETLCSLSRRKLKKQYAYIDSMFPRIGEGLDSLSNENLDKGAIKNLMDDPDKVWANKMADMAAKDNGDEDEEDELKKAIGNLIAELDQAKRPITVASSASSIAEDDYNKETSVMKANDYINEKRHGSFEFSAGNERNINLDQAADTRGLVQLDINHVFAELDHVTELTLLNICSISAVLALSELLGDQDIFLKATLLAHELSMDFVSNTLKSCWKLLNIEIPLEVDMATLRDQKRLGLALERLLELRAVDGVAPKLRMRKLHFKFTTVSDFLRISDIHILPNFVVAHAEGAKCAQFSSFDSNLWLTGGYDCVLRISDIRAQNDHICLAQYVGHKSIITDAHFTKNDTHIISCSYDRTLKIWNSQTAVAEKTLTGHTDAILSCHVSPDGRYVASGSMDCSIKFWDLLTGECLISIRKHTRWVKCVRFSQDGRYLATAGMDKKIYIWDTKILLNSKSPTHSRCIDSFNDYVLDMQLVKPSFLLATSRDSTIRLFDYMTGHELFSTSIAPSWACTVAFSEDGEFFATGSFDNNLLIFRTRDFKKLREIRVFNLGIMCVRFPVDQSYVVVGTSEGFLQQILL